MAKKIITITGASGAGKDSLLDAMMYRFGCKSAEALKGISRSVIFGADADEYTDAKLRELVSHTTRQPRLGEVDGVDYHFITEAEFEGIEKIESTTYAGNHYCLSAGEVDSLQDDEVGVVIVDQHGISCIEEFAASRAPGEVKLFKIFICLDEATSRVRMRARGDAPDRIEARLEQQRKQNEYDAATNDVHVDLLLNGKSDFVALVNEACREVYAFAKE